ncbi:SDR family NAD(P)-dependent oxidoreductase [Rippkaea orientalis]|uniref:SDR family NAD(P)-dependent oxidoreductase n=1 Tax=Rippkaea orientalis TaxID=2546366 RepID=UPI001F4BDBC1|nr:SDR family NAD(P)-dependent oxidoreductase [Rippkaea orientalis]
MTGASSGIGRATAIAFGKAGASVVIVARRAEKGEESVHLVDGVTRVGKGLPERSLPT